MIRLARSKTGASRITPDDRLTVNAQASISTGTQKTSAGTLVRCSRGCRANFRSSAATNSKATTTAAYARGIANVRRAFEPSTPASPISNKENSETSL